MTSPSRRIALYARVSSPRQAQTQTREDQLERLRAHVAAHAAEGWQVAPEHVLRDEAASGATLRRPGLDRLRDLVAARAVDRIVVTAPDRLARKYVHQMLLLDECERHGCGVEFLERPMSQDPHDQLLLQIRGAVAEYERTLIAERMRRGRLRKYQAGLLLPWARAPYGYRLSLERPRDPAGVTLEPAEAAVIRELFATYLEDGMTLTQLATRIQARGVPRPSGRGSWRTSTLRKLLSNPAYVGHVYAGRHATRPARQRHSPLHPPGVHGVSSVRRPPEQWILVATIPAVVSPEVFAQVQAKLAHNQGFARRHNTAHHYLLRALVSCGRCGLACTGRTVHPGPGQRSYYLCAGKAQPISSGRPHRCPARFIPVEQLDALVWADLCAVLTQPERLTQALARAEARPLAAPGTASAPGAVAPGPAAPGPPARPAHRGVLERGHPPRGIPATAPGARSTPGGLGTAGRAAGAPSHAPPGTRRLGHLRQSLLPARPSGLGPGYLRAAAPTRRVTH